MVCPGPSRASPGEKNRREQLAKAQAAAPGAGVTSRQAWAPPGMICARRFSGPASGSTKETHPTGRDEGLPAWVKKQCSFYVLPFYRQTG